MLSDCEILARVYEDEIGEAPLWTGIIRNGKQHGHTSFIDVELALKAMARVRMLMDDRK